MTFIDQWLDQIRRTSAGSTYKMAWAGSITHVACEFNKNVEQRHVDDLFLFSVIEKNGMTMAINVSFLFEQLIALKNWIEGGLAS